MTISPIGSGIIWLFQLSTLMHLKDGRVAGDRFYSVHQCSLIMVKEVWQKLAIEP